MIWIELLTACVIITSSGVALTVFSDRLGKKLHISGAFIGLILLSTVSSLPELGATISVVAVHGKPDMAAGNIFGSNSFNILIIAILDFMIGAGSIFALSKVSHYKSILLALLMTFLAGISIWNGELTEINGFSIGAPLIAGAYLVGLYFLYLEEKKSYRPQTGRERESAWFETVMAIISGAAVVITASWLADITNRLAEVTGWGDSFSGYLFLAISTSLPELVICASSLKLKAYDMALANTIGSCFFNILMFAIADPFYEGDLLNDVSAGNLYKALISIIMLLLTAFSLWLASRGGKTGWAKYVLAALYLLGSWAVFSS